jgi:hypothetical protein
MSDMATKHVKVDGLEKLTLAVVQAPVDDSLPRERADQNTSHYSQVSFGAEL